MITVYEGAVLVVTLAQTLEIRRHAFKKVRTPLADILCGHGEYYRTCVPWRFVDHVGASGIWHFVYAEETSVIR